MRLQPATAADVTAEWVSWLNDSTVNRYLELRHSCPHTIESEREWVTRFLDNPLHLLWLIIHDSKPVGTVTARIDGDSAELGIMIGDRDAWGKNIGTAAILCAMALCQSVQPVNRFTMGTYSDNVAMIRVCEKSGFTRTALVAMRSGDTVVPVIRWEFNARPGIFGIPPIHEGIFPHD